MSKSFEDIYRGLNYDLIKHYEQGVSDERERIIKLLDAELQHPEDSDNEIPNIVISAMIKLIKKESK